MSNRLPILAAEIRKAHAGVEDAARTAAEHAIEAGTALIEAKALVKHGEWLPWLKEHCEISERTAQLYMKIVRLGFKSETVADLGIKAAAKAIAVIHDPDYNPFAHCTEDQAHEWKLFACYFAQYFGSEDAADRHTEWILQRQFKSPSDWLGEEGKTFRSQCGMREIHDAFRDGWKKFLEQFGDETDPLPDNWSFIAGEGDAR